MRLRPRGSGRDRPAEIHATTRDSSLFRRGPPAEVRLVVLVVLAVALIIMDSQLRVLEPVRRAVSVAIYPFQRAVMAPRDLVQQVNEWVNAANLIRSENEALQRQRIELAQVASHGAQLAAENAQLRRLLGVTDTVAQSAVVVEVLYEPTSAFNQRLVFNKGSKAGLAPGMPVIDEGGVVGQIVRVTPMTAEAALVTDEQVSIPVQLLRNGSADRLRRELSWQDGSPLSGGQRRHQGRRYHSHQRRGRAVPGRPAGGQGHFGRA